ncbi:hypothetical protein FXF53_27415 [Micromonospora sp. WP24]|uniref:hypothetical protein n=1 Tax=Micromonospora sp. WP24 TaxID=2604469 RepID=UPI0011D2F8C0|nr:hypothetical protein [Micromonospora sp. WP24]TYB94055.1 hypothetical protein FXF53_27415 [Micromonospora sp. WP24]
MTLALLHAAEWGDVPTWVGAVASLGALTAATVAARVAKRVYQIESERDQQAEADRRERELEAMRAQASRVSAWWDTAYRVDDAGQRYSLGRAALVRNASELPVHSVRVFFHAPLEGGGYEHFGPAIKAVVPPGSVPIDVYPPVGLSSVESADVVVEIEFIDAGGLQWKRDTGGRLHLLHTPSDR